MNTLLLNKSEYLDHVFSDKLNNKRRDPFVMAADDPQQMLFTNKSVAVPGH